MVKGTSRHFFSLSWITFGHNNILVTIDLTMVVLLLTSRLCHQQNIVHLENKYSTKVTGMFIDMLYYNNH